MNKFMNALAKGLGALAAVLTLVIGFAIPLLIWSGMGAIVLWLFGQQFSWWAALGIGCLVAVLLA